MSALCHIQILVYFEESLFSICIVCQIACFLQRAEVLQAVDELQSQLNELFLVVMFAAGKKFDGCANIVEGSCPIFGFRFILRHEEEKLPEIAQCRFVGGDLLGKLWWKLVLSTRIALNTIKASIILTSFSRPSSVSYLIYLSNKCVWGQKPRAVMIACTCVKW